MPRLLLQPHGERLGDLLNRRLQDPGWTTFRSAVAFVKHSGVIHVAGNLQTFARRGRVKMAVGVSMRGTSVEGLESLLECLDGHGEVWVFHNENGPTFHPKMYGSWVTGRSGPICQWPRGEIERTFGEVTA